MQNLGFLCVSLRSISVFVLIIFANKVLCALGFVRLRHSGEIYADNYFFCFAYNAVVRSVLDDDSETPYTSSDVRRTNRAEIDFSASLRVCTLKIVHPSGDRYTSLKTRL